MPVAINPEQREADRQVLLDRAERLFYTRGIQQVGMDDIRDATQLSLKRIYALYPSKEKLVVAVLRRRDERWRSRLRAYVRGVPDARDRLLATFDWLAEWFAEKDFRGCAWINAFGELGSCSRAVVAEVRAHKDGFRGELADLADQAGRPELADALFLLAEGAMVTAGITGRPEAARLARASARRLLEAA